MPSPSPRLHGARVALWGALRFTFGAVCFGALGVTMFAGWLMASAGNGLAGLASRGVAPVAAMVELTTEELVESRAPLSVSARDPPA